MALTLTLTDQKWFSVGSLKKATGFIAATGTYVTGGPAISAASLGLAQIVSLDILPQEGYSFDVVYTSAFSVNPLVLQGASGVTGATSGGTPAAQTFTGTTPSSDLDLATPAFSGTGLTAAGQVITTTSTHTMTLNQCAGMWLISATGTTPPNLILSNTAVTAAAAVLTVQGSANTDAGAYKIVKALTPVGTNSASAALSTHTHTVGAAAGGEYGNGVALTLTSIYYEAYGY